MVQFNKNLGNLNLTRFAKNTKATTQEKLNFKPNINEAAYPTLGDAKHRARVGDKIAGKEIVFIEYITINGKDYINVEFSDGSSANDLPTTW